MNNLSMRMAAFDARDQCCHMYFWGLSVRFEATLVGEQTIFLGISSGATVPIADCPVRGGTPRTAAIQQPTSSGSFGCVLHSLICRS